MAHWIAFVERHRRSIIVLSVGLCALCALSLTRLRLDIDLLGTLPRGEAEFDDYRALVADFGQLDELVVLLEDGNGDHLKAMADALAAELGRNGRIAAVDYRLDTDAIAGVVLGDYAINYLDEEGFAELEARLRPDRMERQLAANRAALAAPLDLSAAQAIANDPLGIRRLVLRGLEKALGERAAPGAGGYYLSPGGDALLLRVRPRGSAFDIAFSRALLDDVRAAVHGVRGGRPAFASIGVRYTGSYAFALEDAATMRGDVHLFTNLSLIGILVVFLGGYRSVRILPFVTYPLVVTTLATFALSVALFDQLNALSISFAAILYGLSIDSGIHFYTRLLHERRMASLTEAVTRTLAHLGRANVAASATTAAAFFIAGLSCLAAVAQLGVLTGIGMMVNAALFFVLYPALALAMPGASARGGDPETPRLGLVAEWCASHATPLRVGAGVLALVAGALAAGVVSDIRLVRLRPRGSEAAEVQRRVESKFGARGEVATVLIERSDAESALRDTEAMVQLLDRYRGGLIASVSAATGLLPSALTQEGRLARFNRMDRRALVERLREALPRHGFKVERFRSYFDELLEERRGVLRPGDPALSALQPVLERHLRQRDGRWIAAIHVWPAAGVDFRRIAAVLRAEPGVVAHRFAARGLLEARLGEVLRREFLTFGGLAIAVNLSLLWLVLRSIRTALAVLVPTALAVLALFAVMAVTGVPLDPVNLIVVPMVLGVGVDYGVYVAAGAQGRAIGEALRRSGRALVVTALTTIAGFGFLGLSHYPALAWLGILTAVGLALALALTIVLLPAIIGHGIDRTDRADRSDSGREGATRP